jgi:YbbR domain-containing protein
MLKNNKINAVIAFVAAVVLWLYVVGQVDPTTTGRVTGVPVVFAGEEVLAENELALVDPGNVTVDLTIKGDRSDVRKLVANSDRISVVADVSGLTKGTHEVTLDITVPNAVELQKASIDEITVEIDDLVTKDIAVEVSYDGAFEVSQEAGNVKIDPESIAVTGAASTVQSIDHLSATVGVDELTEKTTVLTKPVTPVDAGGNPVNHVKLESGEVRITASIIASKTLPLKVQTTGTPAAGFEIGEINAPATVTVSGAPSALVDLTEVKATADVTDLEADATVTLVPDLPSGITVTEPETLEAEITVAGVAARTWSYAESEIVIDDLPEGYEATIPTQTVKVTVSAEKDTLDNIKKSDLVLHVSAAGLAEGEQEAALTQVSSLDEGSVQIDPQTIRIVLTAITTEE